MEWKDLPQWVSALAAVVSACGLFLAYWQLTLMKRMAGTQFEDGLAREYRELAARLPTKAMLGEELTENEHQCALDEFIHYFDLSNEQVFLRQSKRISLVTWLNWRDGIRSNLQRRAFARAWQEIKEGSANFAEFRRLEAEEFQTDPAEWREASPKKSLQPTVAAIPVSSDIQSRQAAPATEL
jgi:hypothetical protein